MRLRSPLSFVVALRCGVLCFLDSLDACGLRYVGVATDIGVWRYHGNL
jgi:hypothetical protein